MIVREFDSTVDQDDIIRIKTFLQQLYGIVGDPLTQKETTDLIDVLNNPSNIWQHIVTFVDTWCTRKMSAASGQ